MIRPLTNWKKDKIYFPHYHQGIVYRTGIPDEQNSFYHSIEYGPAGFPLGQGAVISSNQNFVGIL